MEVPVIAAIIAGLVSLVSAAGTLWSSARTNANAKAIKLLKIESESTKPAAQRKSEISNFSEPLPRSAYDLQSRLYNIMRRNLIQVYFVRGDERTMNIPLCCAFLRGNKELSVKSRLSGRTAELSAWGTVPF
jgi:hypothetical protein